jgi:hypothetical protein
MTAGRGGTRGVLAGPLGRLAAGCLAAWLVAAASPAASGSGDPAASCVPRLVPFQRVLDAAEQVFLVTIATRHNDGGRAVAYGLTVREAMRGTLPATVTLPTSITIAAPVVTTCGDTLEVGLATHLVLAPSVPAFDDAPPLDVVWIVQNDGTLVGGYDDGPKRWANLEAFRNALAGLPYETAPPTRPPFIPPTVEEGLPLASIGIVVGVVGGIVAGLLVVIAGRRAGRRPPGVHPPPP